METAILSAICMGRSDLIGNGKHHLVPSFQPKGTVEPAEQKIQRFKTKYTGLDSKRSEKSQRPAGNKNKTQRKKKNLKKVLGKKK